MPCCDIRVKSGERVIEFMIKSKKHLSISAKDGKRALD
jgi:hypothetical protein